MKSFFRNIFWGIIHCYKHDVAFKRNSIYIKQTDFVNHDIKHGIVKINIINQ